MSLCDSRGQVHFDKIEVLERQRFGVERSIQMVREENRSMGGLDGRYNWYEDADPTDAAFLAHADSVDYLPDGETAITYVGIYDEEGTALGDVGVHVSDLPEGIGTIYRVDVEDEQIVALESGPEVFQAWSRVRSETDT